jgi:hypothetical protein
MLRMCVCCILVSSRITRSGTWKAEPSFLRWFYHTNFVHILSPFGNELIKHKPREARDAMYEIKIRALHKVYKQVFKLLYSTIVPRFAKTRVNPHKGTINR